MKNEKNPYLSQKDIYEIKPALTTFEFPSKLHLTHHSAGNIYMVWVDEKSLKKLKKFVYNNALFFKREFRYDSVGYSENDNDKNHHAFLFIQEARDKYYDKDIYRIIGAGCFRQIDFTNFPTCQALLWVWLHPYRRRCGILRKAFQEFIDKFESFLVESPFSIEMKNFLEKGGSNWMIKEESREYKDLLIIKTPASENFEKNYYDDYFEHLKNGIPSIS